MMTSNALARRCTAVLLAVGLIVAGGSAAQAVTKTSSPVYYGNGAALTASASLPRISDGAGCGAYSSYALITKTPNWIKNVTNFHANGIGASVSGGSLSGSGADASVSWTNSNGAKGSYLSGTVCANWLTWYLSMGVTGSAYHYGTVRTASVSI